MMLAPDSNIQRKKPSEGAHDKNYSDRSPKPIQNRTQLNHQKLIATVPPINDQLGAMFDMYKTPYATKKYSAVRVQQNIIPIKSCNEKTVVLVIIIIAIIGIATPLFTLLSSTGHFHTRFHTLRANHAKIRPENWEHPMEAISPRG